MSNTLPFNTNMISSLFTPLPPADEPDDSPGYLLVLQGSFLLLRAGTEQAMFSDGSLPAGIVFETEALKIGLWQGKPLRAVRIASDAILPDGYETLSFRGPDASLDDALATIAGRAAQILHWERRNSYCSHCGSGLVRIPGGWGKRCLSCADEHYPHIHPCVIVLVKHGAELLLIRNAVWDKGRFSLVAGFVDFGESLEECVQREVREEAGIEVTNIRYVGSQCWPFPSQEMIGFLADYASGEVKPDGVEVVEAGWFSANNLPLSPGSKRSISSWIIETYGKSLDVPATPQKQ